MPSRIKRANELIRVDFGECGLPNRIVRARLRESWMSASSRKLDVCFSSPSEVNLVEFSTTVRIRSHPAGPKERHRTANRFPVAGPGVHS
jgi:hypothetical protein